ncbi:hypothetical protein F7725_007611 [Dissostichus mawsoni]|uniref:Uncharacterized protein n=1 Tax=Dissostichus mawsoni TaxID=36200 RepID=A0A7J5Y7Z0_DISMA|nr:hypothetical protein F7725_007611 [Dissostichus mawsoni]
MFPAVFECSPTDPPPPPLCLHSEAKCLGAKTVCRKAFEFSQNGEISIISALVTDQQALSAVETFLGRLPAPLGPLLVIVCGGSSVDMEQLSHLKHKLHT